MNLGNDSASTGWAEADCLGQRYGDNVPEGAEPVNAVIAQLLSHRSVRKYRADPLPAGWLETIVASAQSASTSSNLQLWSVVSVRDAATKEELSRLAGNQQHIIDTPVFLVFLADHARMRVAAKMAGNETDGLSYLESFLVSTIDLALAAQNAAVAAESLGLGTVYIGGMRNHPLDVARVLGLPPHVVAVFGLCIGFPQDADGTRIKPRLPQSLVLHHERYGAEPDETELARYNDTLRQFQASVGMTEVDWTQFASRRIGKVEALNGRDKLREAIVTRGFELK